MNAPALVSHEHPCPTRTSLGPQGQATQIGEWRPRRTTIEAPQSELLPSHVFPHSSFVAWSSGCSCTFDPRQVDGTKWADLVSKGIRIKVPQAKGSSWEDGDHQGCSDPLGISGRRPDVDLRRWPHRLGATP